MLGRTQARILVPFSIPATSSRCSSCGLIDPLTVLSPAEIVCRVQLGVPAQLNLSPWSTSHLRAHLRAPAHLLLPQSFPSSQWHHQPASCLGPKLQNTFSPSFLMNPNPVHWQSLAAPPENIHDPRSSYHHCFCLPSPAIPRHAWSAAPDFLLLFLPSPTVHSPSLHSLTFENV